MTRVIRVQYVASAIRRASTARKPPPVKTQAYQPSPRPARPIEEPSTPSASPSASAKGRALPWVLTSILAGGMGFYIVALSVAARKPSRNPAIVDLAQQKDVSGRYEYTADSFDSDVGLSEALMLVNRMRSKLAKKCTGNVLEVSCGTGRNLGYFDVGKNSEIKSLTFVDLSPQMVEVCKRKWDALFGSKKDGMKNGLVVRFLTGSALDVMPPPPSGKKYDTVIQTMGLCSTPAPTELLTNMVKHLNTSNPDARILLLEHGRSYQPWLNKILDNSAEKHSEIHGCWYNRDIGTLVEDAARKTGLEVVNERRHHLGTTWIFEIKFDQELAKRDSPIEDTTTEQQETSSWWSWLGLK